MRESEEGEEDQAIDVYLLLFSQVYREGGAYTLKGPLKEMSAQCLSSCCSRCMQRQYKETTEINIQ